MINSGKIFFVIVLMIFAVKTSFSQNLSQRVYTLKANSTLSVSDNDVNNQTTMGTNSLQAGANGSGNGIRTAKQVRGSRPDMAKPREHVHQLLSGHQDQEYIKVQASQVELAGTEGGS
jgi:hypothetical protein